VTQELHARLQPLLIFFIDAASFVDDDQGDVDARWELYTAVETTAAGHDIIVRFYIKTVPSLIVPSFFRSRWQSWRALGSVLWTTAAGHATTVRSVPKP